MFILHNYTVLVKETQTLCYGIIEGKQINIKIA